MFRSSTLKDGKDTIFISRNANSEAQAPKEKYCRVKQPREDNDHEELNKLLKSLPHDDQGILQVGSGGDVRTLTADRDVLGAVALPPKLLKAMLDIFHYSKETEDKFRGVDGTFVPREEWFHHNKS